MIDESGQFSLRDEQFIHLLSILKLKENDSFKIGVINEKMGVAQVLSIGSDYLDAKVLHLDIAPPKKVDGVVLLAMPRPNMLRRILQHLTELGIKDVRLFSSSKVEKSFWQSPLLSEEKLKKCLIKGLEQSKDVVMPKITQYRNFSELKMCLESINDNRKAFVAHPYYKNFQQELKQECPVSIHGAWVVAIGPEGGFEEKEVDCFVNQGFTQISLGQRILRVENAVMVICGRLSL